MPNEEDTLFLRAAVEAHALEPGLADEVLGALAQVESLGAMASATEIVLNRGLLTPAQVDQVLASCGLKPASPASDAGRMGNFQILGRLGVGAMGVVYKARQLTVDRLVALKMLPPRLARDPGFVERLVREARVVAALNHPNIVQVLDVGEADGLYYFAMELVDGETLGQRIRRLGRLPEKEALEIVRQTAAALDHAHAHGIIHRDVKPDNILLTKKGVAKLADLGLAMQRSEAPAGQSVGPTGTPLYMSPEQARGGEAIDIRADIYSLGATLYHAVVGSPPFTGPNSPAILSKHLYDKVPSPRDAVPALSDGLCHVVMKMLAKRPFARYASPAQLMQDLDRLLQGRAPLRGTSRAGTPAASAMARRTRQRRSPKIAILVAAGVLVCAVGGWVLHRALSGPSGPPPPRALPVVVLPPKATAPQGPSQEELARTDLQHARESAPDRTPKDAIRRFRAVASKFPNTAAAREAAAEAQAIEARLAVASSKTFEAATQQAKALAAEGKYGDAVEFLDKLGEEHPDLLPQVSDARGLLLSDAMKAERDLREQANQLAEKGDFAGAIGLHQQILAFGVPSLTARAKREVALLEEQKAAADRKARADAEDAYEVLRLKVPPLLEGRKYAQARTLLGEARDNASLASVRADIEADLRDLEALLSVWTAAERAARSLQPTDELTVGGIRGTFVRFDQGILEINASKLAVKKPLAELPTKEVVALAARQMKADDPAAQFACALFFLAEGKEKEAAAAIAEGERLGGDAKRLRVLSERRRSDAREGEAETLFARAEEQAAAENWKPVAEALRSFEQQFVNTRSNARHRAKAEELGLQARAATLELPDLFHGAARLVGNGHRIELTYDFSSPDQLADWEVRGAQAAVEDGHLTLRGALALLRAPLAPDLLVTLHLTDVSGPPGEWGLSLAQSLDTPPPLALALPERQGLQAILRTPQKELTRGFVAFRVNQPRKLALSLRSRRVTVASEGKDVLGWALEAGPEPSVRLGLWDKGERTVQVQNVRLSATVADNWATAEIERLRSVLGKELELHRKPWVSLFGGVTLSPWASEVGIWDVVERAATTTLGGSLILKQRPERLYDDLEFRLKLQPAKASSLVRVAFRLAKTGEHYALALGGDPPQGCLTLNKVRRGGSGEILARFPERVAWQAGKWYELSILAAGSELRADLDGSRLFIARDDRRHKGTLAIEVPQGGAAFKDMALRSLD
jgi:serine/threonine-protein kinase